MKKYVFFCEVEYSYPILRPLQDEIWRRGDEVCWYLEKQCPDRLRAGERRLLSIRDVIAYKPLAIFSAGNYIYDFFPGVKVKVFHGYPVNKRNLVSDNHFRLRGWHDLLCTSGPNSTLPFQHLSDEYGYFKVYETGWVKADLYARAMQNANGGTVGAGFNARPSDVGANPRQMANACILFASTFSRNITCAPVMLPVIERLAQQRPWHWLLTLHPLMPEAVRQQYRALAARYANVEFRDSVTPEDMMLTDVLLCDSSSIIVEYMLLNKPVVTYRNTQPGPHLLNVEALEAVPAAIETALTRPPVLMTAIHEYVARREAHLDGHNCLRVLQAVDDFVLRWQGKLAPKPRNLFRKLKLRLRLHYFHW